jgi:hypothetical protein
MMMEFDMGADYTIPPARLDKDGRPMLPR